MPETSTPGALHKLQSEFAAHIRDPANRAMPAGIENRRMKIYRELFFNNVSSLLSSNFPVLRALYDDPDWDGLVRDFYATHYCQTPLFPELPREFLRYVQDERGARPEDPAFLTELAHYEWVELALFLDERELDDIPADTDGDLVAAIPVLSPLAWPLSYRFPVHRIRPEFRPETAPEQESHLLVYRNRNDAVKFMQLNNVSRLLIALMQENQSSTGIQLLHKVGEIIKHPQAERIIPAGTELLQDLKDRDIVLGTRPV